MRLGARRHRPVRILADVQPRLEAQAASHVDLADAAVLNELDRLAHGRAAAVHRADLHDLAVGARGVRHQAAFQDGVRGRLLDVDVLAGLERPDGGERVPVVRRGNHHRVDVLVVEHAPQILHEARLERGDVLQLGVVGARGVQVLVDVAERLDLDVLQFREAPLEAVALPVDTDAGGHDPVVRADDAVTGLGRSPDARPKHIRADGDAGRCYAETRREVPPGDAILFFGIAGQGKPPSLLPGRKRPDRRILARRGAGYVNGKAARKGGF